MGGGSSWGKRDCPLGGRVVGKPLKVPVLPLWGLAMSNEPRKRGQKWSCRVFNFVLFLFSTGVNRFKLREGERETDKKIGRKK